MNASNTFNIVFGNKNLIVVFNPEAGAKIHKIGLNGTSWKSVTMANAISNLLNVANRTYSVMEEGLYLHVSFAEMMEGLGTENGGYVTGIRMLTEIAAGTMSHKGETVESGLYRVRYDGGFGLPYGSLVTVPEYVKGEHEGIKHNRRALALISNLELIRKAEKSGINIQLFWTQDEAPRFAQLQTVWNLFVAQDYDGVADLAKQGIAKAATYNTMKHYEGVAERAKLKGETFALPVGYRIVMVNGETIDPMEMVGMEVQLVALGHNLPFTTPVDADNVVSITRGIKARGLKAYFVLDAPVAAPAKVRKNSKAAKTVNVPVEAELS